MTDYKALCAELLQSVEESDDYILAVETTVDLVIRARAALAEPVPEGPSDHELTMTYAYAVAAAVDNKRGPFKKKDAEVAQLTGLRAVLDRWGQ
jgi:hypothetical protein